MRKNINRNGKVEENSEAVGNISSEGIIIEKNMSVRGMDKIEERN